jgi:hypothetical protein
MDDNNIRLGILAAMGMFMSQDEWLIINDLSEQSMTHKMAIYLQDYFSDFDVDCEYNGDIDNENARKSIRILKDELKANGLIKESDLNLWPDFVERTVYPDIIIHRRGTNDFNLCVIEVKKSTSSVSYEYDFIKLRAYTAEYNHLNYSLGVFIEIVTGSHPDYSIRLFKNGGQI